MSGSFLFFRSLAIGLFFASNLLGLLGCTGTPTFSRTVYEDPTIYVRLHSPLLEGKDPARPNSHPAAFTVQELAAILGSVRVEREVSFLSYYVLRKDPKPEPAFDDSAIRSLAPHVKAALAKANPPETVVFLISRDRGGGVRELTSGGLFVRGEQLHLLLANFRVPVTTKRKMERAREAPLTSLGDPDFLCAPGPYHTLLRGKDASGFLINYKALLAALHKAGEPSSAPLPSPDTRAPLIEKKLRQLKAWREQGLITEPEYQKKRAELLESF